MNQSQLLETPLKSGNMDISEEVSVSRSANNNNILETVFKLALNMYNMSNYRIELCCLNGCDVIDIRRVNDKQYLYYSKFTDGEKAETMELCEINQAKPTRLLYHPTLHSVFFNDLQQPCLHEYSLETQEFTSHNMKKVVLDMTMNTKGFIIGIHNNGIFSFEANEAKRVLISKYKTVKDLHKISNCFNQHHFAIASEDGNVRIFDLNNYGKAINKFKMPAGITSLQISDSGNYILCRYGHKAHMITCQDKYSGSMFESRTKLEDRKASKKLVKGYEHLWHLQFSHKNSERD